MKKTFNINLSGVVFTMDEDAYDLLNDYLDTLEHAFSRDEDAKEIVKDIESRAAELLIEMQGETRNVVTLSDIEEVIGRIGRPEEMMEEIRVTQDDTAGTVRTEETATTTDFGVQTPPPPIPGEQEKTEKKLYRDPQNAMLGGVCAGLAAYLHVDVTWVRLLTVAISLLSVSTACVVYVILWIILPEARTPYQRMQMSGEAPTIANIGRSVTSQFKGDQGGQSFQQTDTRTGVKRFLDNFTQILGILAKIILVCVVIVCIPLLIALAIGLLGCIFAVIVFSTSWGAALWGEYPGEIMEEVGMNASPILCLFCAIAGILTFGIPIFALLRTILFKRNPIGKGMKTALATAWGIAFIAFGVLAGIINLKESVEEMRIRALPRKEKNIEIGTTRIITSDTLGTNETMIIQGNDTY